MAGTQTTPHLTGRQREILERISRGRTNIQIADELGIGFETVKMHLSDLLAELGVTSREEAAEWWRASRRPMSRLRAILPGLSAAKLIAGGAGVVAIGAVGVAGIALASSGGSPGVPAPGPPATATLTICERTGADCPAALLPPRTPFVPTANILSVSPPDGGIVGAAALVPSNPNVPNGVCAVVTNANLPQNFQHFQMFVDGAGVTTQLVIVANPETLGGKICYDPPDGLILGDHGAVVRVLDSGFPGAKVIQEATWTFTVVPDGAIVEPDAAYPIPSECGSELVAAVFNHFFAAWNSGDAQTMFDLVNDSRGVWFDLGYDPLTFASAGEIKTIEVRTLDDFRELVTRYAGMHWTFYGQPTGSVVTTAPNAPGAVDGGPAWRLTGPALTAAGKTMVFGSGKFGVYCDTHKLFGVMGRPTVQ